MAANSCPSLLRAAAWVFSCSSLLPWRLGSGLGFVTMIFVPDLLGPLGQGDDPFHFLADFRAVVQHAAGVDRPQLQTVLLELGDQRAYLIG